MSMMKVVIMRKKVKMKVIIEKLKLSHIITKSKIVTFFHNYVIKQKCKVKIIKIEILLEITLMG